METKYGTISEKQVQGFKKHLHKIIHWLLIYKDTNPEILNNYFNTVQFKLNGLNELLKYPEEMMEIMILVESARIEFNKTPCNHKLYRHAILDAHDLVDELLDKDSDLNE